MRKIKKDIFIISIFYLFFTIVFISFITPFIFLPPASWSFKTNKYTIKTDISRNGDYFSFATGGYIDTLYVFHNSNPPLLLWKQEYTGSIQVIAMSSNGEYLVVSSGGPSDYTLNLYKTVDSTPLWGFNSPYPFRQIAISSNGSYIVATSYDTMFLFGRSSSTPLWNYNSSMLNATFNWLQEILDMSSDGTYIAVGCNNYDMSHLFLFNRFSPIPIWNCSTKNRLYSVSMSYNGDYIAAGGSGQQLLLFNNSVTNPKLPLWNYSMRAEINLVKMSPNGKTIIASNLHPNASTIYLFNISNGFPIWNYSFSSDTQITTMDFDRQLGDSFVVGTRIIPDNLGGVHFFSRFESHPIWSYSTSSTIEFVSLTNRDQVLAGDSNFVYYWRYLWVPNNFLIWITLFTIIYLLCMIGVTFLFYLNRHYRFVENIDKRDKSVDSDKQFYNLLSESKELVTNAYKLYSKKKFASAIDTWKLAISNYALSLKHAPFSEEKEKIRKLLRTIKANICNSYFEDGKEHLSQAKIFHNKGEYDRAELEFNYVQQTFDIAIDLIKTEDLAIEYEGFNPFLKEVELNLRQIGMEKLILEADHFLERAKASEERDLSKAIKLTLDAMSFYFKVMKTSESEELESLIKKAKEKIRITSIYQSSLQEQFSSLLEVESVAHTPFPKSPKEINYECPYCGEIVSSGLIQAYEGKKWIKCETCQVNIPKVELKNWKENY